MVTTVKLQGEGTEENPYHVNLPDYKMILVNYDAKTAIVQVADTSHGLTEEELSHEKAQKTSHGLLVDKLCDDCTEKAHANFDTRYEEHAGKFRFERGQVEGES